MVSSSEENTLHVQDLIKIEGQLWWILRRMNRVAVVFSWVWSSALVGEDGLFLFPSSLCVRSRGSCWCLIVSVWTLKHRREIDFHTNATSFRKFHTTCVSSNGWDIAQLSNEAQLICRISLHKQNVPICFACVAQLWKHQKPPTYNSLEFFMINWTIMPPKIVKRLSSWDSDFNQSANHEFNMKPTSPWILVHCHT